VPLVTRPVAGLESDPLQDLRHGNTGSNHHEIDAGHVADSSEQRRGTGTRFVATSYLRTLEPDEPEMRLVPSE
jgi:hypothetical protein